MPFAALVDLLTPLVESIGALPGAPGGGARERACHRPAPPRRPAGGAGRRLQPALRGGGRPPAARARRRRPLARRGLGGSDRLRRAPDRRRPDRAPDRDPHRPGYPGIPSLQPRPLTGEPVARPARAARAHADGLEAAVRDAAGNPLALVELATFSDGRFEPGRSTLEEACAMVETLPGPCRAALLLLATCRWEGTPVIGGRWRPRGSRTRRLRRRSRPASSGSSRAASASAIRSSAPPSRPPRRAQPAPGARGARGRVRRAGARVGAGRPPRGGRRDRRGARRRGRAARLGRRSARRGVATIEWYQRQAA